MCERFIGFSVLLDECFRGRFIAFHSLTVSPNGVILNLSLFQVDFGDHSSNVCISLSHSNATECMKAQHFL